MTQQQLIPMGPGERFRYERELKKLSIADAARQLHVSEEVLLAIEADNLDRFAPIYRRGYQKAYARLLGIAADDLEELLAENVAEELRLESIFPDAAPRRKGDRWLRATSYVLASLLVGTLAWQFTHEAVRLSQTDLLERDVAATVTAPVATGARRETHVNASIASLESIAQPVAKKVPQAGEQAWAALGRKSAPAEVLKAGEHLLEVKASADSWVEIRDAHNVVLEQDLVRGGHSRQYKGFTPFRVTFGRSSAIVLLMDGEPVDLAPFTREEVTQMILDEAANQRSAGDAADADS